MFERLTFQQLIESSGILGNRPPSTGGWREVKCAVCKDHKTRAGFLFDSTAGVTIYHCFNCSHRAAHDNSRSKYSANMQLVIDAFGIDVRTAKQVLFTGFSVTAIVADRQIPKEARPATEIQLPSTFVRFNPSLHQRAANYLTSRSLPTNIELYVDLTDPKWKTRVIFPVRNRTGGLVFYQGRTFINQQKRWNSPDAPKTGVMYNSTLLYQQLPTVLIHEGIPDALSVPGVAILGSEFSDYHLNELNSCKSVKIIVPNKDDNGVRLAAQGIKHGFHVSFPDIGDCADINEAVNKYGRMYVEHEINVKAVPPEIAEFKLNMWKM